MDRIRQCPRCELRFPTGAEWTAHLVSAHPGPVPSRRRVRSAGRLVAAVDPARAGGHQVRIAAGFARQTGKTLDLVAVPPPGLPPLAADAFLRSRLEEARAAGPTTIAWSVLEDQDPADAIIDHVGAGQETMVCLGTRARSAVRELLLGSVSETVLRRSPVPVLLVGPRCAPPSEGFTRVVACVDGSPASDPIRGVAERVAQQASLPPEEFRATTPWSDERLGQLSAAPSLEGAEAAAAVLRHLDEADGTVAVLGTEGRNGFERVLFESVAIEVVRHARGPVLVLPPRLVHHAARADSLVTTD